EPGDAIERVEIEESARELARSPAKPGSFQLKRERFVAPLRLRDLLSTGKTLGTALQGASQTEKTESEGLEKVRSVLRAREAGVLTSEALEKGLRVLTSWLP
ncbi:MAG: hypothetical protein ACJ73Y_05835, partial [Rubrobacteraceae bacterium]